MIPKDAKYLLSFLFLLLTHQEEQDLFHLSLHHSLLRNRRRGTEAESRSGEFVICLGGGFGTIGRTRDSCCRVEYLEEETFEKREGVNILFFFFFNLLFLKFLMLQKLTNSWKHSYPYPES